MTLGLQRLPTIADNSHIYVRAYEYWRQVDMPRFRAYQNARTRRR